MARSQAIVLARRIADLAKREKDLALAARIENAGLDFVTAARGGDATAEPPKWLQAMLNDAAKQEAR